MQADGTRSWTVCTTEALREALTHPCLLSDPSGPARAGAGDPRTTRLAQLGLPAEAHHYFLNAIVDLDPPRHTRLRRLVSREFTARRTERLRGRIVQLTDRLLDELPGHADSDGAVDLVAHLAYPLPLTVICELIGIPEAERSRWHAWSGHLMAARTDQLAAATPGLIRHIHETIAARRARPQDDLLSGLVQAGAESPGTDAAMTDDEIVSMVLILVLAGHETTAHLIANGTFALLTHPDQLAALRRDPGLLPGAVEELLRWCGPVPSARMRYASQDIDIHGVHIRQGDTVLPLLDTANIHREGLDHPGRLDLHRPQAVQGDHHLAFGHGIHFCLGAALARLEATVALGRLLDRYGSPRC